jgi:subfamily B ATP-binding cassette protein MsbA
MSLFWRFLGFARPYRLPLISAILMVFVTTGLSMPMPMISGKLIDQLRPLHVGEWVNKPLAEQTLDLNNARQYLYMVTAILVGLAVIGAVIGFTRSMILMYVGNRIVFDVRSRLFRHIHRLSMRYFERNSSGRIMSRILYDVDAVQSVLSSGVVDMLTNLVTLLVVIGIVIWYSIKVESILLPALSLGVLPLYVMNFLMMQARIRQAAAESRDQFSEVYSTLSESIAGVRVIKAFAREQHEARRFVRELREAIDLNMRTGRLRTILGRNAGLLTQLANVGVLFLGGIYVLQNKMTIGELVAFRSYQTMLYHPVIALVTINDTINWVMAAVERIFETLDTMPDVQEADKPIRATRIEGRVEFKNVGFYYEPGEIVLQDINVTSEPGTVTALVGPSGSGKTTMVHLVPRFYDPTEGTITVDGMDLRDVLQSSLRRHIGMVLQENFLFQGTLRENIKYGRPEATDEEVVQASIAANCHDFIMEFPDGYETVVGERGTRLSGGQRQRIAIARALLRNPRILILDEATSDLDSESEALIQDALEKLMKNRTTFIIAHRLSTVMNADQIMVLDHGHIVERGTHAELATAGGLYAKLCEVQFKRAQEKVEEHLAKTRADRETAEKAKKERQDKQDEEQQHRPPEENAPA